MHHLIVRVLTFGVAVLSLANAALAQPVPKAEISGGYQFLRFVVDGENQSMPTGWYFDVAGNLNRTIGLVFQTGGNYKTFEESATVGGTTFRAAVDLKVHEFLGGVRLNARPRPGLAPFAQVLAGGINGSAKLSVSSTTAGQPANAFNNSESGTNFALQAGGGVNVGVTERLGIRIGADYLRLFADEGGVNLFRFHAGVVFTK